MVEMEQEGEGERERKQSTTEYFMYEKSASLSYLKFKILPIQIYDEKDAFCCVIHTLQ
jgi:hypothetical protein